ncbi:ROK family protein [Acidisoma cellulosilytica]|uniref:ROK family protein n=1 Tax=Acidisoma cellulosilyticum TaxID=2802395 RepID=A0A963Z1Z6_9PROT|nr:ROK family protein [Acidisoma cellulosilyticum]MCB8881377.1 ROK family protein [Acidisoma cellulosilyticum]
MQVVAGVDLGGTGCRFVIYGDGQLLAATKTLTRQLAEGSEATRIANLARTIRAIVPSGAELAGVGLGASGPVDCVQGVIHNPDTLPGFSGFPIGAGLARGLGVPVVLDNDAVVAAIGEQRMGAGKSARRMLMITLGTGIGVAFVVDGSPFRGPGGLHPEAGHIPILDSAQPCYCGAFGCWEQLASRAALQDRLRPHLPGVADLHLIAEATSQSDKPAIGQIFMDYGRLVGRGLSVHHALYMPERTIIGGSVAPYFELFRPGIMAQLTIANKLAACVELLPATLGDEAGAIGAAFMVERYLDHP